jgi:hypothetical protein
VQKFTELCGWVPSNRAGHIQKIHRPMRLGWNHMGLLCACMACIWERQKSGLWLPQKRSWLSGGPLTTTYGLGACWCDLFRETLTDCGPPPTAGAYKLALEEMDQKLHRPRSTRPVEEREESQRRERRERGERGESEERESERRILRRSVSFRGGLNSLAHSQLRGSRLCVCRSAHYLCE